MGPAAILALLSVAGPIIGDVLRAERDIKEGQERVEITRTLEAYRYGPHGLQHRKAIVSAVADKLPKKATFMAPALLSARRQWEVDITVGLIETEMWK
jgi:hypothetical protein